jgi:hypothetical protein
MARLPEVGGDAGNWGQILNDYLSQSHSDDGTIVPGAVGAPQLKLNSITRDAIADGEVTGSKIADQAIGTEHISDGAIDEVHLNTALRDKIDADLEDGAVTTSKLANGSVTAAKLAVGVVGDSMSTQRALVPAGYRARTPFNSTGNVPSTVRSNGTNLGGTHRMTDIAQVSGSGVVLVFSNFVNNGTGEASNGNDYTIVSCTIETGTDQKNIPVLFGGSKSHVVKDGLSVSSDIVGVALSKGQRFSVRCVVSVAAGQKFPLHLIARGDPWGEGISGDASVSGPGVDLTGFTDLWMGTPGNKLNVRVFGPSAVLIRPAAPTPVLLAITDSIGVGTGESVTFTGYIPSSADFLDEGWITRAVKNRWLHFIAGLSGTNLSNWISSGGAGNFRRRNAIERMNITHILNEDGINDLQGGATASTVQTRAISAWRDRGLWGRPQYQSTITPLATTSNDHWTTAGGQTLHSNAAARISYNAWLRDGAPMHPSGGSWLADVVGATGGHIVRAPYYKNVAGEAVIAPGAGGHLLAGIIEASDAIESTRDSGRFAAATGSRIVTDASYTAGAATLTSPTAAFTASDLGRPIVVLGAGPSAGTSSRIIVAVVSATQVTLDSNASTSVTGATARIGAYGTVADGVHPSGSPNSTVKGGHELIADYVRPIFAEILGAHAQ